jgi:putative ABC transport system ATP-binding protein
VPSVLPPPLLWFDSVSVTAPGTSGDVLLADVDAQVEAGSITVLVGPSGSGKSTLLRLGNRLDIPTDGRVLLDGVDIAAIDARELRRQVAMVFQRPVMFPGTVADNFRVADQEVSIGTMVGVLGSVGLDETFLDRTGDDLSGGEAQRVCIARALLTHPKILLMDEPTSSLDPSSRLAIEELARGLAGGGLAIMWVTHDHAQMARLADRVVVLREGRRLEESEAAAYLLAGDETEDR